MSGKIVVKNRKPPKFWHLDGRVMELPVKSLSSDAKLYYGYLCSRPDTWVYNRGAAMKFLGTKHKLDKCNKELKQARLITVIYDRDDMGRFVPREWVIESFEDCNLNEDGSLKDPDFKPASIRQEPKSEKPDTEKPCTDLPYTEKPATVNPDPVERATVNQEPLEENILELNNIELNKEEDKDPLTPKRGNPSDWLFDDFWSVYPRKERKQAALAAWKRIAQRDRQMIIDEVESRALRDAGWLKEQGKFVPGASKYLREKRWEDEWQGKNSFVNDQSTAGQTINVSATPVETWDNPMDLMPVDNTDYSAIINQPLFGGVEI